MKNLGIETGTIETNFTNRKQEMKDKSFKH